MTGDTVISHRDMSTPSASKRKGYAQPAAYANGRSRLKKLRQLVENVKRHSPISAPSDYFVHLICWLPDCISIAPT